MGGNLRAFPDILKKRVGTELGKGGVDNHFLPVAFPVNNMLDTPAS